MTQITYSNKVALNVNPNIDDINKVTDDDMNEIKSVVNENATQLDNLEPVVLFSNPSGSSATITLSDSSANYTRIDIEAALENRSFVTTVYDPDGKTALIFVSYVNNATQFQTSSEAVSISGNTITRGSRNYLNITTDKVIQRGIAGHSTPILKVTGYK